MRKREKQIWGFTLLSGWLLCRYGLLFALHGMREWPAVLFSLGTVVLAVAAQRGGRWTVRLAACGYLPCLLLAAMTCREGFDPGGGAASDLWMIWTVSYLFVMALGVVLDVFIGKRMQ